MKKFLRAAVLLLGLGIMTVSCTKTNPSSSISGTWQRNNKISIYPEPTEAQKFAEDIIYAVFSGNTVSFKDEDNKEIGKGTFTYSVTDTETDDVNGTMYRGKISISGLPLKGGDFERTVTKMMGDVIKWTDVDYVDLSFRQK